MTGFTQEAEVTVRYHALACDYDGTIAHHGRVSESTLSALRRTQESGRRIILVTGRRIDDLYVACPEADVFDCIVAENGAVFYDPRRRREVLLSDRPDPQFVSDLKRRGVMPVDVGRAVVATWEPHESAVMEAIHHSGLELQMTFNKGAIMILPSGVNKNSGLRTALRWLGLSPHNTIGVGDAENDHAFLMLCEFSAAVANALDSIKSRVDLVTRRDHGGGVEDLIEELLRDDLRSHDHHVRRHDIRVGVDENGAPIQIPPFGTRALISGPSGSGKSTIVSGLLERLAGAEYQFCVIDPEGDYENLDEPVNVGDETLPPAADQVLQLISKGENTVVNLLSVPVPDRPAFAGRLLQRIQSIKQHIGLPHWLLLDEAHHMLPAGQTPHANGDQFGSEVLVTVHPRSIDPKALESINVAVIVGPNAQRTLEECSAVLGRPVEPIAGDVQGLEVLLWFCKDSQKAIRMHVEPAEAERRRHRRKYAEGDLREKSFIFRGPEDRLKLRAQNLALFVQIAEGVDEVTWQHHLEAGDYSAWVRSAIKDELLADEIAEIERAGLAPAESLEQIRAAIERLYTGAV